VDWIFIPQKYGSSRLRISGWISLQEEHRMGAVESLSQDDATLQIEIYEAKCLKDFSGAITGQDPYIQATCMPSRVSTARTLHCPAGNTAPVWTAKERNLINLKPVDKTDFSVMIEVKNANYLIDDTLAKAEVVFKRFRTLDETIWLQLSPEGVLALKLTASDPKLFPLAEKDKKGDAEDDEGSKKGKDSKIKGADGEDAKPGPKLPKVMACLFVCTRVLASF
jgi:hypothetical protein